MTAAYRRGFADGEFDALSHSYEPESGFWEEEDSVTEYEDGYEAGYDQGIQKRRAEL